MNKLRLEAKRVIREYCFSKQVSTYAQTQLMKYAFSVVFKTGIKTIENKSFDTFAFLGIDKI